MPTEAGQVLYGYAVRKTDLLLRAEEGLRQTNSAPSGRLTFGLPLSVPLAETVRLEMPRVQLCTIEAMSGRIKPSVGASNIDLELLYDLEGLSDCSSRLHMHETLRFYAAGDDRPVNRLRRVTPASAAEQ